MNSENWQPVQAHLVRLLAAISEARRLTDEAGQAVLRLEGREGAAQCLVVVRDGLEECDVYARRAAREMGARGKAPESG